MCTKVYFNDGHHGIATRPAMSLRPSVKDGSEYNRYEYLYGMLQQELQERLAVTPDGDPMWNLSLTKNDPKALGPPGLEPNQRRPRMGSFEVSLSFDIA